MGETFRCERLSAFLRRDTCARRREVAVTVRSWNRNPHGLFMHNDSTSGGKRYAGIAHIAAACRRCEIGDEHLRLMSGSEEPKARNQRTPREK